MIYDTVIIGNGPAGLTAAIYAKRAGLVTLLVAESPVDGGQIATTYDVDNYPGMKGIGGQSVLQMHFPPDTEH
ncbi:MAG: FAD-dependent oxidoreductase [Lachnospiraceae bacterium]|nr:FAD-dependent oxidoreductase [Lachnospiraceae bacterium]